MNFKKVMVILTLVLGSTAWSRSEICDSKNIKKISRPILPNSKVKSESFFYSYFHLIADEGQPTVVFIPGGPGQTSIDNKGIEVPKSFGIIYTDPRGVGCNEISGLSLSSEFYTTENVASDIVGLVADLKLNNYIIYGQSWGTAVAQIAVNQIEKLGLKPPKALVLEGVIGRAMTNKSEAFGGFVNVWRLVKNQLEPEIVEALSSDVPYMGLTSEEWGSIVRSRLVFGEARAIDFLTQVSRMPDYTVQAGVRTASEGSGAVDLNRKRFYDLIACRQMYNGNSELNRNIVLNKGELELGNNSFCRGIKNLNPYNSKQWQIKTKTYYFSGSSDPLTPIWQRDYHMNNQKLSKKIKITVIGGGHLPLKSDLYSVASKIWNSINNDGKDLAAIVEGL